MKAALVGFALCASVVLAGAEIVTKPIQYEQGGTSLQGYLAYDDALTAKGKLPGVLVIHEWWGLNDFVKGRAEALAKLGYVAFAVDMYGGGQSTTDPAKAKELATQLYGKPLMAERAQAGLDQLLKTDLVDPSKVAAIGFCFGGSTCQVLAYSGAPLRGIVVFHGGLIPAPEGAAEKNKAKFLILEGALDPSLKKETVDAFLKALDDGKFDYQYLSYSGALHAFMNPDADKFHAAGLTMVAYNAEVAKRAWNQMQLFFKEIFGESEKAQG
jgi:dienelactone hydrolase